MQTRKFLLTSSVLLILIFTFSACMGGSSKKRSSLGNCPVGQVFDANNTCVDAATASTVNGCSTNSDCASGQVCSVVGNENGVEIKACTVVVGSDECLTDANCASGEYCNINVSPHVCASSSAYICNAGNCNGFCLNNVCRNKLDYNATIPSGVTCLKACKSRLCKGTDTTRCGCSNTSSPTSPCPTGSGSCNVSTHTCTGTYVCNSTTCPSGYCDQNLCRPKLGYGDPVPSGQTCGTACIAGYCIDQSTALDDADTSAVVSRMVSVEGTGTIASNNFAGTLRELNLNTQLCGCSAQAPCGGTNSCDSETHMCICSENSCGSTMYCNGVTCVDKRYYNASVTAANCTKQCHAGGCQSASSTKCGCGGLAVCPSTGTCNSSTKTCSTPAPTCTPDAPWEVGTGGCNNTTKACCATGTCSTSGTCACTSHSQCSIYEHCNIVTGLCESQCTQESCQVLYPAGTHYCTSEGWYCKEKCTITGCTGLNYCDVAVGACKSFLLYGEQCTNASTSNPSDPCSVACTSKKKQSDNNNCGCDPATTGYCAANVSGTNYCDNTDNKCKAGCRNNQDCASSEFCNASHQCQVRCTSNAACGSQYCNSTSGMCENCTSNSTAGDAQCGTGRECVINGSSVLYCRTRECMTGGDCNNTSACGSGYTCTGSFTCSRTASSNPRSPQGYQCGCSSSCSGHH